ncbi:hypothetical protein L9F63_014478, partial [Diploptera punctata]
SRNNTELINIIIQIMIHCLNNNTEYRSVSRIIITSAQALRRRMRQVSPYLYVSFACQLCINETDDIFSNICKTFITQQNEPFQLIDYNACRCLDESAVCNATNVDAFMYITCTRLRVRYDIDSVSHEEKRPYSLRFVQRNMRSTKETSMIFFSLHSKQAKYKGTPVYRFILHLFLIPEDKTSIMQDKRENGKGIDIEIFADINFRVSRSVKTEFSFYIL